jgi:hypothetical protein
MTNIKITDLPKSSGITPDDLFVIVDDPYGTKVTKSIFASATIGNATIVVTPKGSLSSPIDHTNIQSAINALPSGGRVFLQAGNYYLSNRVNISKPNIEVVGAGRSTLLNCVGDYGDVFHCELPYVPEAAVSGLNGLVFSSMRFESTVPRTSGAAIYAAYTHQATFRDLYICDSTYGRTFGSPNQTPANGGPGYLYYTPFLDEYGDQLDSGVVSPPLPIPFYNGIEVLGQDQINIDRIVCCASNRGISIQGSNYDNADFSYDGVISKCHLWGIMKGSGVGIHLGPGIGGFLLDYCSLNAWGTGIFATAIGTSQGGGIVTIRDGFSEGCTIGYKTLNMQNTVVTNLWSNIYASGLPGHKLHVMGAMQDHNIQIAGGLKALVVAMSGAYTVTGNASNFTRIG